jgi:hypothetical protein
MTYSTLLDAAEASGPPASGDDKAGASLAPALMMWIFHARDYNTNVASRQSLRQLAA